MDYVNKTPNVFLNTVAIIVSKGESMEILKSLSLIGYDIDRECVNKLKYSESWWESEEEVLIKTNYKGINRRAGVHFDTDTIRHFERTGIVINKNKLDLFLALAAQRVDRQWGIGEHFMVLSNRTTTFNGRAVGCNGMYKVSSIHKVDRVEPYFRRDNSQVWLISSSDRNGITSGNVRKLTNSELSKLYNYYDTPFIRMDEGPPAPQNKFYMYFLENYGITLKDKEVDLLIDMAIEIKGVEP